MSQRPIVFVMHSMGGLVVKKVRRMASNTSLAVLNLLGIYIREER